MRYRTILFDLDHTLLDSHASEAAAFAATIDSIGVVDPDGSVFASYDRINQSLWRRVESGELDPNEVKELRFTQLLDELHVAGDPVEMGAIFGRGLAEHGDLYPGAFDLLESSVALARVALVTNGIGVVQRRRIARLGLGDVFDAVVISGEVGTSKPGTGIFDLTFDLLGVEDRSSAVMIGDSLGSDIRGGVNAGIATIWFNPHAVVNTMSVTPTHEATSLSAVAELLAEH